MKFLKKVPLAISGLSLALAALGNLLLPYGEALRYCCGIISAAIFCIFVGKLIFDSKNVQDELKSPVVLSTFPTSTMTLLLLCAYVAPFWGKVAVCLWYAAIIIHLLLMALFIKRFVIGLRLETVFPSWFVAGVGIVVASTTSPVMEAKLLGQVLFCLGLSLYFVIAVLVIYRMVKIKPIPEPARPTIAILTAPMSLCIAGYFSVFDQNC